MRSRAMLIALLALTVWVAVPTMTLAQDSEIKALNEKVDALEKRIATMERNLTQQLSRISQQLASGGGGNNAALENEAQASLGQINRLIQSGDTTKAKADMAAFMKKYGSTKAAQSARRTYQELQVIGKTTPANWGINKWFQGESAIDLASNKTTLVVFWETWCPHCQREVPKLQSIYDSLSGQGLQVIGLTKITKSSTEEKVASFIKDTNMTYPVAKEDGSASSYFGVSGIPAAAVLQNGKVVWRGHPAQITDEMIEKHFIN